MEKLQVKNIGPIANADIDFGDLTIFVGQQATGKSLLLQLFDLLHNPGYIKKDLSIWGYNWKDVKKEFYPLYFGGGMESAFSDGSEVIFNSKPYNLETKIKKSRDCNSNHFYIPAHRVMVMDQGWARPFTGFDYSYPYVMKQFSEFMRLELDNWSKNKIFFPQPNRLRKELRGVIQKNIFRQGEIIFKTVSGRKQLVMSLKDRAELSVGSWSAGQKEFAPLLFGLYWALPAGGAKRRENIKYVTIEEPEMGLHPSAILDVMLMIFELLLRGYKITISTHSNTILELMWGIAEIKRNIKKINKKQNSLAEQKFLNLFKIYLKNQNIIDFATEILNKSYKVYFFSPTDSGVTTKDITSLDIEDEGNWWGGIAEFSGKVADVVGSIYGDR